jgi:hypothetical protein
MSIKSTFRRRIFIFSTFRTVKDNIVQIRSVLYPLQYKPNTTQCAILFFNSASSLQI